MSTITMHDLMLERHRTIASGQAVAATAVILTVAATEFTRGYYPQRLAQVLLTDQLREALRQRQALLSVAQRADPGLRTIEFAAADDEPIQWFSHLANGEVHLPWSVEEKLQKQQGHCFLAVPVEAAAEPVPAGPMQRLHATQDGVLQYVSWEVRWAFDCSMWTTPVLLDHLLEMWVLRP